MQLDVKPVGERENASGSLYTIHYQSKNRDQALQIVKILVHSFVGDTLGGKQSGSDEAQKFLREQIKDYEQRLHESESRLADFKRQHVGAMPGTQGDYFARLQNEIDAQKKVSKSPRLIFSVSPCSVISPMPVLAQITPASSKIRGLLK